MKYVRIDMRLWQEPDYMQGMERGAHERTLRSFNMQSRKGGQRWEMSKRLWWRNMVCVLISSNINGDALIQTIPIRFVNDSHPRISHQILKPPSWKAKNYHLLNIQESWTPYVIHNISKSWWETGEAKRFFPDPLKIQSYMHGSVRLEE